MKELRHALSLLMTVRPGLMEMVKQARSEFFMSKGILGSIAAQLVSSGLISAQVPVYNGPPLDGAQAPPPLNHMDGAGDFHPGHADVGHPGGPGGPGDFQQGGVPGGWPPFWIRGE